MDIVMGSGESYEAVVFRSEAGAALFLRWMASRCIVFLTKRGFMSRGRRARRSNLWRSFRRFPSGEDQ